MSRVFVAYAHLEGLRPRDAWTTLTADVQPHFPTSTFALGLLSKCQYSRRGE